MDEVRETRMEAERQQIEYDQVKSASLFLSFFNGNKLNII